MPPLDVTENEIKHCHDKTWNSYQAQLYCRERHLRQKIAELASSQEALRLAREENERLIYVFMGIRRSLPDHNDPGCKDCMVVPAELTNYLRQKDERMQQAVATLNLLCAADRSTSLVSHAIRLLSPEGSSR